MTKFFVSISVKFSGLIITTICVFRKTTKFIGYLRTFSFGWDFTTETDFGVFDPLTLNYITLDTQKAHSYAKRCLLSHSITKSVENCVMQADRRDKQKKKRTRTKRFISHPHGETLPWNWSQPNLAIRSLYLSNVINRSQFGIDWYMTSGNIIQYLLWISAIRIVDIHNANFLISTIQIVAFMYYWYWQLELSISTIAVLISTIKLSISSMYLNYWYPQFQLSISIVHESNIDNWY